MSNKEWMEHEIEKSVKEEKPMSKTMTNPGYARRLEKRKLEREKHNVKTNAEARKLVQPEIKPEEVISSGK